MILKPGYGGQEFEVPDNAVIADIGSGHHPLPEATFYIDKSIGESPDRAGLATVILPGKSFILADACKGIPLPDKCCDFVSATHVAEHVEDPEAFCKELSRIGKEGYIETPGIGQEIFEPILEHKWKHKWYVFHVGKLLVFKHRNHTPFIPVKGSLIWRIFDLIEYNIFQGGQTRYHWKDRVWCVVIP